MRIPNSSDKTLEVESSSIKKGIVIMTIALGVGFIFIILAILYHFLLFNFLVFISLSFIVYSYFETKYVKFIIDKKKQQITVITKTLLKTSSKIYPLNDLKKLYIKNTGGGGAFFYCLVLEYNHESNVNLGIIPASDCFKIAKTISDFLQITFYNPFDISPENSSSK